MLLTLFFACPLLLISLYLGVSSLEFRMTFSQWVNQPKAVPSLICMALAASAVLIDVIALLN